MARKSSRGWSLDYAPLDLFTIEDGLMPSSFKVSTLCFPDGSKRSVILYEELSSFKHHKGLIEQNNEQLKMFFDRKKQIDEELASYI